MKRQGFRLTLVTAALLVAAAAPALGTGGTYEAQLYGITEWTSTCSGGSRSWWDDMGDAWYNEITDSGFSIFGVCLWGHCDDYFTRDRRWVNGSMSANPFTEQNTFTCGRDRTYVDEGDAALIFTHGGDDGLYWRGLMRYRDCNDDCYINARDELRVGDYDLEFLHLSSCHSMDDNMIPQAYRIFGDDRLHQVHGFHGCMWIGSSLVDDYRDFADDGFEMPVALAWMINHYHINIVDSHDQCPIAYAVGSNADDCFSRLTGERYNAVRSDPSSIGYYCYYYYEGCDPDCEDTFGNAWR